MYITSVEKIQNKGQNRGHSIGMFPNGSRRCGLNDVCTARVCLDHPRVDKTYKIHDQMIWLLTSCTPCTFVCQYTVIRAFLLTSGLLKNRLNVVPSLYSIPCSYFFSTRSTLSHCLHALQILSTPFPPHVPTGTSGVSRLFLWGGGEMYFAPTLKKENSLK